MVFGIFQFSVVLGGGGGANGAVKLGGKGPNWGYKLDLSNRIRAYTRYKM